MSKAKQTMYVALFLLGFLISGEAVSGETRNVAGMVKAHNEVRKALCIQGLVWSDKLADFARQWAVYLTKRNRCKMRHRPRKGRYSQRYGENIYWASALIWSNGKREIQKVRPDTVVKSWASEAKDYDYESNSCQKGRVCGHYTQIVWKNTRKLGCGMAVCSDKGQIWVCNYDPPGNYIGRKPY